MGVVGRGAACVRVILACAVALASGVARAQSEGDADAGLVAEGVGEEREASGESEEREASGESEEREASDEGGEREASGESEEREASGESEEREASGESEPEPEAPSGPNVEAIIGGYVEGNYTFSLAQPSNGVIALRGFDNQHNTFTLANVALNAQLDYDRVYAVLGVQWGNTPTTYYLAEPTRGAIGGTGPSDASTWRWLQVAYAGWNIPVDGWRIVLQGGLFLSPIGVEALAVRANVHFSRSDLFYGCPFYHSGIRLLVSPDDEWTFSLMVFNGWNTLLDNNDEKSISVAADWSHDIVTAHLLYFTGVERNPGWEGGRAWRHLIDAYVIVAAASWLSLTAHVNFGFEPSTLGLGSWQAFALYASVLPIDWMWVAARGDFFRDDAPNDSTGTPQRIFWPTEWVSSVTATVGFRPIAALSFYLEYRHDQASGNAYYAGSVPTAMDGSFVFNSVSQDTLTLGVAAGWDDFEIH